jgi:hypothetical protein
VLLNWPGPLTISAKKLRHCQKSGSKYATKYDYEPTCYTIYGSCTPSVVASDKFNSSTKKEAALWPRRLVPSRVNQSLARERRHEGVKDVKIIGNFAWVIGLSSILTSVVRQFHGTTDLTDISPRHKHHNPNFHHSPPWSIGALCPSCSTSLSKPRWASPAIMSARMCWLGLCPNGHLQVITTRRHPSTLASRIRHSCCPCLKSGGNIIRVK